MYVRTIDDGERREALVGHAHVDIEVDVLQLLDVVAWTDFMDVSFRWNAGGRAAELLVVGARHPLDPG